MEMKNIKNSLANNQLSDEILSKMCSIKNSASDNSKNKSN